MYVSNDLIIDLPFLVYILRIPFSNVSIMGTGENTRPIHVA